MITLPGQQTSGSSESYEQTESLKCWTIDAGMGSRWISWKKLVETQLKIGKEKYSFIMNCKNNIAATTRNNSVMFMILNDITYPSLHTWEWNLGLV